MSVLAHTEIIGTCIYIYPKSAIPNTSLPPNKDDIILEYIFSSFFSLAYFIAMLASKIQSQANVQDLDCTFKIVSYQVFSGTRLSAYYLHFWDHSS